MPTVTPAPLDVTAATFAGMTADDYPVGQRVIVSDDGNREHEARGADGSRVWVELHTGTASSAVADHEAEANPHGQYLTEAEADNLYHTAGTVWMPLVSIVSGTPTIVLDDDDALIPTEVPL